MTNYPNIKEDVHLEFIEYTSDFIAAENRGSVNANPFNYALAACSFMALSENDYPGMNIDKAEFVNGIKLFNALTKSSVSINFE